MIVSMALIIWKALMCLTGSESPVVVVLSGDILFLHMSEAPFRAGEIVVYNVGEPIPIVHRVVENMIGISHRFMNRENNWKGDANDVDDRGLYAYGQYWLKPQQIMGRAVGSNEISSAQYQQNFVRSEDRISCSVNFRLSRWKLFEQEPCYCLADEVTVQITTVRKPSPPHS
ncbi:hypothetical protein NC653_038884 [Populus alba x Populus x berolinensis]|uniref:Signal peptidase I n=1 Tax=Populus alba x Populus x berolinensis TaxID=444605 RepID=A0AAD6LCG8_9ROSI|nr:hypothetical protein NC653_038884 [Populus alba x Populus x berolinensis]